MNPAFPENSNSNSNNTPEKRGEDGISILITYAEAGAGHFKAAEALYNYLKESRKEIDVKLVDILGQTNAIFRAAYMHGYSFFVRYAFFLWKLAFWITASRSLRRFTRWVVSVINRLNTKSFAGFLIKENPDFIISTHFLPAEIAADLKTAYQINSKIFTIITDFGVHPFWIREGTDIYIVASNSTKEQLMLEEIGEERIKEFGIPIDSKFLARYERGALAAKFDINPHEFTVLIVTGSFGIGPITNIVNLLYKDVRLLVVCARNRRLYKRLTGMHYPNVSVFGFVDNIQELMGISDVIITKPGGLTISEILATELVPLFISPIPGQETENIRILNEYGVGMHIKSAKQIKEIILDFKNHPHKLNIVKENIRKIKKPFATSKICNAICQDSIGLAC